MSIIIDKTGYKILLYIKKKSQKQNLCYFNDLKIKFPKMENYINYFKDTGLIAKVALDDAYKIQAGGDIAITNYSKMNRRYIIGLIISFFTLLIAILTLKASIKNKIITKCNICNSILEYDNKSVWECCREREDFLCPICGNKIDSVFTDQLPNVRVIEEGEDYKNKNDE